MILLTNLSSIIYNRYHGRLGSDKNSLEVLKLWMCNCVYVVCCIAVVCCSTFDVYFVWCYYIMCACWRNGWVLDLCEMAYQYTLTSMLSASSMVCHLSKDMCELQSTGIR